MRFFISPTVVTQVMLPQHWGHIIFFKKINLSYSVLSNTINKNISGKTIILGGGGNLIEGKYNNSYNTLQRYISKNICIILPHTIYGYKDILKHTYSNLFIFCRDYISYNRCLAEGGNPQQIYLSDDMAFHIDKNILDYYRKFIGSGFANCLRTDRESLRIINIPHDNRDISRCWDGDLWHNENLTNHVVNSLFSYLCQFDTIVTDRLHVAILSALIGRKVKLYSNNYYKNESVYNTSLRYYNNVQFIDISKQIDLSRQSNSIYKFIKSIINFRKH